MTSTSCVAGEWTLIFKGGAEFAYIRLNEDDFYLRSQGFLEVGQKSKIWGIGPQLGIEVDYNFWRLPCQCPGSFSLVASTSGSILASKAHQQFTSVVNAVLIQDVDDEDTWRLIPAWHARLGVNYQACIFYYRASLEVGYEFHTYLRSFTRIGFPDNLETSLCYTNYCNFSMQGFYAAATLSF